MVSVIEKCINLGLRYPPITGKKLTSDEWIKNTLIENKSLIDGVNITAQHVLAFSNALQTKYELCEGGASVIEERSVNFINNLSFLENNGIDKYTRMELDLSRKRKILSILVPKVLSNNEFGRT